MADDDDDVAISGDMEPEQTLEDLRSSNAGGGDDDDVPALDMPSGAGSRRGREISPKTRELFAKAAADLKRQQEELEGESPFGTYDEGYTPPARKQQAEAKAQAQEQAPAPVAPPQEEAPPAPSLAPEVSKRLEEVNARAAELEERERRIAEQERTGDIAKVRTAYFERGGRAVADMLRGFLGKEATEEEVRAEIADLISDLSTTVLGVDIPDEIKTKMEAKRAIRSVKVFKESLTETEALKAKREQDEQQKAARNRAIHILDKEITDTAKPYTKEYPWLAAEDNPGEIITEVVEAQHRKDGTVLHWTEAAKRANEYLQKKASAYHDKRRHLFTAAPDKGASAASAKERPQGDPQGIRRSHTLTNAQASAASPPSPAPPPTDGSGKWSREAHRAATRSKYRAAFAADPDE